MSTKLSAEQLEYWHNSVEGDQDVDDEYETTVGEITALLDHITALGEELKRFEYPCGGCGGPHEYDTSVPSPLWNRVVREQGLSDYLCASCIVKVFARARTSFTAELYGPELDGPQVPHISVQINETPIDDSYGCLQARIRELEEELKAAQEERDRLFELRVEANDQMAVERHADINNFRAQSELKAAEDLAYMGEHHFPDATWKARCMETVEELKAAQERGLVDTAALIAIHDCDKCDLCEDHHE